MSFKFEPRRLENREKPKQETLEISLKKINSKVSIHPFVPFVTQKEISSFERSLEWYDHLPIHNKIIEILKYNLTSFRDKLLDNPSYFEMKLMAENVLNSLQERRQIYEWNLQMDISNKQFNIKVIPQRLTQSIEININFS